MRSLDPLMQGRIRLTICPTSFSDNFQVFNENSQNHSGGVDLNQKQGKTWTQHGQLHLCRLSVGQNL